MSSHDAEVDVDVDVCSSPEPSPRGANTTDDESPQNFHMRSNSRHSPISTTSAAAHLAASLLTTSTANLSPVSLQTLQNHSAHLLSSQYHNHLSNSLLNGGNKENHISATDCGRLSPPRTPETNNNNNINSKMSPTTTTNSGFTSFSISSILSRQDSPNSKKLMAPLPAFPINGPQDAAMISR